MSVASEGIWFPIANNHHPRNPTIDQSAHSIKSTGTLFSPADIHQPSINDQSADNIQLINPHETSGKSAAVNLSRRSPIGSQAKDLAS
jgi:hypothetical protein